MTDTSGRHPRGTHFRENARAIIAMVAAMSAFILNDTLVKLASDTLPIGEILFLRGAIAVLHGFPPPRFLDSARNDKKKRCMARARQRERFVPRGPRLVPGSWRLG